MPDTLTTFDSILKVRYGPRLITGINDRNELNDLWKKGARGMEDPGGRYVEFPFHYGRNTGVGAVGASEALPVAGNQAAASVQVPFRYNYVRVRLQGQVIKLSETNKMAFVSGMTFAMQRAIPDAAHSIERQLWANGNGVMARVSGSVAAGTLTIQLRDPLGVAGSIGGARYLQEGDNIVFVRSATINTATDADIVAGSASVTISTIASDGASITVDATVGADLNDGDYVVLSPADSSTVCSINKEIDGLLAGVDDGTYKTTYHNVNRSTRPLWSSKVTAVNGDYTNEKALEVIEAAYERYGMVDILLSHSSVRNEYLKTAIALKRFVGEQNTNPDMGFKAVGKGAKNEVDFCGRPWRNCRMSPYRTIFGVNRENLEAYVNTDLEWIKGPIGGVWTQVAGFDLFEAVGRRYSNNHVAVPTECFRIDGLNATVEYVQL